MMCRSPIVRKVHGVWYEIPCGQCVGCRLNRAREWSIRIMNELVYHKDACFLTLTYDDDHLPDDYSISKYEFQKFMKRFRKEFGQNVRYFASGEYGDHGQKRWINPHYHVILFGVSPADPIFKFVSFRKSKKGFCGVKVKLNSWNKGDCFVGDVTYESAAYVARYCAKSFENLDNHIPTKDYYLQNCLLPPFLLMSRRPGIGAKYVANNSARLIRRLYVIGKDGKQFPLPRFYKNLLGVQKTPEEYLDEVYKRSEEYEVNRKTDKSYMRFMSEARKAATNIVEAFIRNRRN